MYYDYIVISLSVPPQNVTISPMVAMKAGISTTLTCNSGTSNPRSVISWFKNETEVFTSDQGVSVQEVSVENGAYGGKVTVSR